MGAHPSFPSRLAGDDSANNDSAGAGLLVPLDQFIARDPESTLGREALLLFGNTLPFLFKVLSAASPLSLQVHPSKRQATEGYARENESGIPLTSPERNYKDSNHKPEIIMAITPFTAMCGFRNPGETLTHFSCFKTPLLEPALASLRTIGTYGTFCKKLLELAPAEKRAVITDALKAASECERHPVSAKRAFHLMRDLAGEYPDDIGILSPLYLNVIDLEAREAMYLPAGIMHAYVKGTGLELMASSDNVLRGGLTPKHIDVRELLNILNPDFFVPEIIPPPSRKGMYHYRTPSTEFELSSITPENTQVPWTARFPAICMGGEGTITVKNDKGDSHRLLKGTTIFIPASGEQLIFSGEGTCFMASIPQNGTTAR